MLVEFRNVSKAYKGGSTAVSGLDFSIEKGEFILLVGPSGAGKTTIMKLIYMDEFPTNGEVRVGHYTSRAMTGRRIAMLRRQVGVVFQEFRLLSDLSVFENIALPLRAAGKSSADIKRRVSSVLYAVGLSSKRHQYPLKLSGGEQQRVAIARALINDPLIILADEPTGNLDTASSRIIMSLLLEQSKKGITVIVVTHEQDIAAYTQRTIYLRDGQIIEEKRR